MKRFAVLALVLVHPFIAQTALASEAVLAWQDLIDTSVQSYEDPYRDLTYDQLDDVRAVVLERSKLAEGDLSAGDRKAARSNVDAAYTRLAEAKIDVDWLISQRRVVAERRRRAATAGNAALDGGRFKIAGFVIPSPPEPDGTPVAYLVPERGMCSHLPPPPPNQMIRLQMPSDWTPDMIYEPVRVAGQLRLAPSEHQVMVVDGLVPMQATFSMDVRDLETMGIGRTKTGPVAATKNELAVRLLNKFPAAEESKGEGN